ncbi:UNVERIFIED_CONTAM: hypothetical protein GTU68_059649 [Idotea baltica]|nr:hypothetical protein [Idotea baltica]
MSEETENNTPEEKVEDPAVEAVPTPEETTGEDAIAEAGAETSSDETVAEAVGGEEKSEKLMRAEAILQQQAGNSGPPPRQGGGGQGRGRRDDSRDNDGPELFEKVVFINRCAKVVKGGRRFSFSALVVTGDQNGKVGYGFGKAKEVAECIRKASETAKKSMVSVKITENTITHDVLGEFGGGRVLLRPASPGTGIIAGGGVRAVVEAAGIKDILAKSMGSNNHANVVKATLAGLESLRTKEEVYKLRGKKIADKASL